MTRSRSRETLVRTIQILAIAAHLSGRAIAATTPDRELPDYDGRGGPPAPPGKALLWVPRVIFFPLYLTSEYLVRRPLGWLITNAERAQVPAALYNFFAFGPDHKAGFVPVAFVEFGFRPSFGIYAFWDDAGWTGHDLRLHASTGGNNWFAGSFTERFRLADRSHWTLNVSASRRPDYAFFGIGPLTSNDDRVRYGADAFDARAVVEIGLWRSSKIETAVGFRSAAFRRGYYLGQATIEDRAAGGTLPLPDGYSEGYEAGFTRAKVAQIHCPVLIVHGDIHPLKIINQEIVVPELKAAGKPVEYIEYTGQPHAFWWGMIDPAVGEKVFDDAMRFLKPHLRTQPATIDESLIKRVPVGGDRAGKRKGKA